MRLISFSLTKRQFRERTKTVTRRLGWENLKVGELLMGCEKVMGRKRGEELIRMGAIRVVSVRRERLDAIDGADVIREGFANIDRQEFIAFFCASHKPTKAKKGDAKGCTPSSMVTRIEFEYT